MNIAWRLRSGVKPPEHLIRASIGTVTHSGDVSPSWDILTSLQRLVAPSEPWLATLHQFFPEIIGLPSPVKEIMTLRREVQINFQLCLIFIMWLCSLTCRGGNEKTHQYCWGCSCACGFQMRLFGFFVHRNILVLQTKTVLQFSSKQFN